MTRHETFTAVNIADKDLVLATDLDGTFLGGTKEDRSRFYEWIEAHRDRVGLIFVTGRDPGFITEMTRSRGVPRPDFVVGDVGTTIAEVEADHELAPIETLEAEISSAWRNSGERVRNALADVSGLTLQRTSFRYRVSYDLKGEHFDDRALAIVNRLGLDALISDNRYFDVLPKGISKGPSLLRLLSHLGVSHHRTLVAGDTLNDLSMLSLGLPAVAVGNSEPALVQKLEGLDHVILAEGEGVAGIAEAIAHSQMFSTT
jgi:HAD superfamily hydrolase (TIGR01484 family)